MLLVEDLREGDHDVDARRELIIWRFRHSCGRTGSAVAGMAARNERRSSGMGYLLLSSELLLPEIGLERDSERFQPRNAAESATRLRRIGSRSHLGILWS